MQVTEVRGEHFLKVLTGLLTPEECKEYIDLIEDQSTKRDPRDRDWHDARPDNGATYMRGIRLRPDIADDLFARIQPVLHKEYEGHVILPYLNPCIRFSKYYEGGRFAVHHDGQKFDSSRRGEFGDHGDYDFVTLFTLNISLNKGFGGGETDFFHGGLKHKPHKKRDKELTHRYSVEPEPGRAALFYFDQPHLGNVVRGVPPHKYLMRTDVMAIRK